MRCIYCSEPVFGLGGITIPHQGPAHVQCFSVQKVYLRQFKGLDLSVLTDAELAELKELLLAEENSRQRQNDVIELF